MKHLLTSLCAMAIALSTPVSFADGEGTFERKLAFAKKGDLEAQYDVGYRYEKGRGVDEDEELALSWFVKAAEQGMGKAQYKVGLFYMKGQGVEKNSSSARKWLQKAADQDYPPAQYQLGKLYAGRYYRDYDTALIWLKKAQRSGYEPATGEILKIQRKLN